MSWGFYVSEFAYQCEGNQLNYSLSDIKGNIYEKYRSVEGTLMYFWCGLTPTMMTRYHPFSLNLITKD